MNILYIITIFAIYTLFMLIHKTEKKQNLVQWLAITAILILCYNILASVILTFIDQLCTLQNLSICNFIIIAILLGIILKNKKIQKYHIKVLESIFSILLLVLVTFIAYKQYGFPFNIKYEITDASTHYFFAEQFNENSTLLYNEATNDFLGIYNSSFRLPGAYVNEGILFKIFENTAAKTDLFIIFDLFILYISGILFYYLIKTCITKENKILQILAIIFSILYMLGYQLNSMLYGYVYLSLALDIIITFLLIMVNYEKREISKTVSLPILALLSFGVFFSYAYFIPIIYISIIINMIIKSAKNKEKILSTSNLIEVIYLIIIPLMLGFTYFIILPIISGMKTEISTIGVDGAIYENYITNYLPFIPIFLISIISSIKNKSKKISFPTILFISSILFAIILWIGNKIGIVSKYYFFKSYYIIWLLTLYNTYLAITYLLKEKKLFTYTYVGLYIIVLIITVLITKNNIGIGDIFYKNMISIKSETPILKNGELKIQQKVNEIADNDLYILAPIYQGRAYWISVLFENQYIYIDFLLADDINIEKWLSEKQEQYYLAYHQDYAEIEEQKEYLDQNSNEYKILYNDEYAFILERK